MLKKIITFILNFILILLCILIFAGLLLSKTVLNKDYLKEVLSEKNFYERTLNDINDGFVSYTMQSGLELEILDNLISLDKVTEDVNKKLDSIFEKETYKVETAFLRDELDSRINKALEENNRKPSDSEKTSIEKYEQAMEECYDSGIFYGKYVEKIHITTSFVDKILKYTIIAIIIDVILIVFINLKIGVILNSFGKVLMPVGILILLIKPLLESRVQNILIMDQKFSNCLVFLLNDIIGRCFKYGLILAIIGFCLILISSINFFAKTIEDKND